MNENASVSWVDIVNIPTGYTGVLTWTYTTTMDTYGFVLDFDTRNSTSGDMALGRIKLERGNKSTDWTPAPEDAEAAIANAQETATNALTSANGKNTIYYQTSEPTGGTYKAGDTWFDTNDGNKIY